VIALLRDKPETIVGRAAMDQRLKKYTRNILKLNEVKREGGK
jgi:hypothetical protein